MSASIHEVHLPSAQAQGPQGLNWVVRAAALAVCVATLAMMWQGTSLAETADAAQALHEDQSHPHFTFERSGNRHWSRQSQELESSSAWAPSAAPLSAFEDDLDSGDNAANTSALGQEHLQSAENDAARFVGDAPDTKEPTSGAAPNVDREVMESMDDKKLVLDSYYSAGVDEHAKVVDDSQVDSAELENQT